MNCVCCYDVVCGLVSMLLCWLGCGIWCCGFIWWVRCRDVWWFWVGCIFVVVVGVGDVFVWVVMV